MIWALVFLFPLLAALLALVLPSRSAVISGLLFAATIPALLAACWHPPTEVWPWFLLGSEFGIDESRRIFLLLAALLWAVAGWFSGPYLRTIEQSRAFCFFFLAAMAGNFGLIIAQDVPSFYTFFALMTFASYGLVVHARTENALRAGRIYLVMAIFGELLLITALYFAMQIAGSLELNALAPALAEHPRGQTIFIIVLIGFGVKVGAIPLYFWLPLAHPVAPTPASAVLSGSMIKAGLIGWLHLAPIGLVEWTGLSVVVIGLGSLAALGAAGIGLCQTDPKTNLAYSSISQMGLMTVLLGIGLEGAISSAVLATALAIYAFNHGLAKGLLFLGTALPGLPHGAWRWVLWAGMAWGALSIAGGPLTGGACTKYFLKALGPDSPQPWAQLLPTVLILSAIATTILLARLLYLLSLQKKTGASGTDESTASFLPWMVLLGILAGWVWMRPSLLPDPLKETVTRGAPLSEFLLSPGVLLNSLWPVLLGLGIFLLAWKLRWKFLVQTERPLVPPGDFLEPILAVCKFVSSAVGRVFGYFRRLPYEKFRFDEGIYRMLESEKTHRLSGLLDSGLRHWPVAGGGFLLLFFLLLFLLR